MLVMPAGCSPFAGDRIVLAKQVEERSAAKFHRTIGLAFFVHQQGEGDSSVFAKVAGVSGIAQPNGHQTGSFFAEGLLMLAQLRDMLAAEDSAVVTQENDHSRAIGPQRTHANGAAVGIGQCESGQFAAE